MLLNKPKRDNIGILAISIILLQVVFIATISYCVVTLIANPQIIGEYFGEIAKGYDSAN